MANCLVTKLKAVVNNPNLPLLETMQQFTLDAIAASGNSNMTDAQKLALNHFFYEIGAINQDGVWNKINMLMIPMLATPTAGYTTNLVHDYKYNSTLIATNSKITGVNGGLSVTVNTEPAINIPNTFVNSDSAAIIFVQTAGHTVSTSVSNYLRYSYDDNSSLNIGTLSRSAGIKFNVASGAIAYKNTSQVANIVIIGVNVKNGPWSSSGSINSFHYDTNMNITSYNDVIITDQESYIDHTGHSVTGVSLNLGYGSNDVFGLIMSFTSTLTDEERNKVCAAALALRSAFEVQNN